MKTRTPRALRPCKRRGEWAETLFMSRAIALGFQVARPWGDTARYDLILERDGRFYRVQVKSTQAFHQFSYRCMNSAADCRKPYSPRQIDILALYIIPLDLWYIIPARALAPARDILVYPQNRNSRGRYERFREAWHFLE